MADVQRDIDRDAEEERRGSMQAKCLVGHVFNVRKSDIRASASGKSFVTSCPKCGRVARLNREKVLPLFGYSPRDLNSMKTLLDGLKSTDKFIQEHEEKPKLVEEERQEESDIDDAVSTEEEEYDSESDYEVDEDVDESEDEDEDDVRLAILEDVDDVTGERSKVSRARVVDQDHVSRMRSRLQDIQVNKLPRSRKNHKKDKSRSTMTVTKMTEPPRGVDIEEESEYVSSRYKSPPVEKRKRPQLFNDKPLDRNEILKKVVAEEIGDDNDAYDRIAALIDLQPEGVNPIYAQSALELHFSKQMVMTLIRRWEAEIAIQSQKRMREQETLNMLMSTSPIPGANQSGPGLSYYARFGNPPPPPAEYPIQAWRSLTPDQQVAYYREYHPEYCPPAQQQYQQDPRFGQGIYQGPQYIAPPPQVQSRQLGAYEIREIIESAVEERLRGIRGAIAQREDSSAREEARELRQLVFEIIRDKATGQQNAPPPANTQVDTLLSSQSKILDTLLRNTLETKPDVTKDLILREIQDLKKNQDRPESSLTHEELRQRIELQKLSNEFELARQEFMDKREGRQFTRDIAEQALKRIGETIATAYVESSRLKMAGGEPAARTGAAQPPTQTRTGTSAVANVGTEDMARYLDDAVGGEPTTTRSEGSTVAVQPSGDGISFDCPQCGDLIRVSGGETSVTCARCGSVYDLSIPSPSAQSPAAGGSFVKGTGISSTPNSFLD